MNEIALIGKKLGMSREFYKTGQSVPVTVVKMEKGRIIQVINENDNITFRIPWEAGYDMEQETETVGPAVAFYASG